MGVTGAVGAIAASVSLAWNPNPETDLKGYRVYRGGTNGGPDWMAEVGLTTLVTVSELNEGSTYRFTVTAVNEGGLESDHSDPVFYSVPGSPPVDPPPVGELPTPGAPIVVYTPNP